MNFKKDAPVLGFIAGLMTAASGLPQAWSIHKTNDTSGVSLSMCLILLIGEILWSVYAVILGLPTLLFFQALTALIWCYIAYKKFMNLKKDGSIV